MTALQAVARPDTTTRPSFDFAKLALIVMFAWTVLPPAIQNIVGGRPVVGLAESVPMIGLASAVGTITQLAVFAAVGIAAASAVLRGTTLGWWFVVYLLPCGALALASVLNGKSFTITSLVYVAIAIAVAGAPDKRQLLRTVGGLTVALAFIALAMAALVPSAATSVQGSVDGKAIVMGSLLNGPFYHPNMLGTAMVLGLPWVFLMRNKTMRWVGVAAVILVLLWTASRTSIFAVVVSLVIYVAWRIFNRATFAIKLLSQPVILLGYLALIPIGIILVATSRPESYSARGYIWMRGLEMIQSSPIIGFSSDFFGDISQTRDSIGSLAFHGHNMFVNTLLTAGIVGVVALVAIYIVILMGSWKHASQGAMIASTWGVIFICLGWLEVPTTFYGLNFSSWVVFFPLAIVLSVGRDGEVLKTSHEATRTISSRIP